MRTNNNIAGKINFYLSGLPDMDSARPHDFLCKMDEAEDVFIKVRNQLSAQIDYGEMILRDLPKLNHPFGEDFLPKLEAEQVFLAERHAELSALRNEFLSRKDSIRPHDTLPETLNKAIETIKDLFDQLEVLRWAIMEHNVDYGSKGEPKLLSSSDEIDAFISSL